jgi:hypothetical protein
MKKATLLILSIAISQFGFSQIIYTDVIPDDTLVPDYVSDSHFIDFNGDFTSELVIFSAKQDTVIQSFPVTISGIAISTLGNTQIIASITTIGSEDVVVADTLNHGHVISSASSYMSSATPSVFPGVGLGNLFFGVKFEIGTNIHYGWVQVKVAVDANSGVIYDYAYQSIADSSILAGNVEGGFVSVLNDNLEEAVIFASNKKLHIRTGNQSGILTIHNLLGKQLMNTQVKGNINFAINDLSKGIYLVSFTNGRNTITKKVYIE